MKEIINILDTKPISTGYYDNITNIGIIKFNTNDMIKYYNDYNKLVLLIKLLDTKLEQSQSIDIMVKATAMPDQIYNNNYEKYSIPPFEYYFSYLNDNYVSYNLSLFNKNYNYMSIELIFSSNKIDYALLTDKSEINNNIISFYNETNKIKIVDKRFQDNKRSLILLLNK